MREAYAWNDVEGKHVVVNFVDAYPVTYCTITVIYKDGLIKHYHGGTVYNVQDRFNERTGKFNAFKDALQGCYIAYGFSQLGEGLPIADWCEYHKHWTHFLAALMDDKIVEPDELNNPNFF